MIASLIRALAASLFVCITMSVQASPITWQLQDVTFDDGGIATGSLTYDYNINSILDWNITTSGGDETLFPTVTYDDTTSSSDILSGSGTFLFSLLGDTNRQLRITPVAALDGSSASVDVQLGAGAGTIGGEECYNCSPYRQITGGSFVSRTSVPEAPGLLLLGIGLFGVGFAKRRA